MSIMRPLVGEAALYCTTIKQAVILIGYLFLLYLTRDSFFSVNGLDKYPLHAFPEVGAHRRKLTRGPACQNPTGFW